MRQLVMVGVDPGYRDVSVLQWSTEWAAATDQELLVVSGFEVGQSEVPPDFHDELLDEAHRLVDAKVDLVERGKSVKTESLIIEGHPTEVLVDTARSQDPSIVALGSRGEGGYDQLAVGGVAHRVASELSRPVAIVRHMGGPVVGGTVIVGVDGSDSHSTPLEAKAIEWAIQAGRQTGSKVIAVCTGDGADSNREDLQRSVESIEEDGADVEVISSQDEAADALCKLGDERSASMIVIGSKGAGGLLALLSGKVAAQLIEKSDRPVVLIHQM